ncbi:MAG: ABC transporter substrate-binding protein [Rhodospirillales bacterium]|nr:ABC transporter substrate-binding protein [Rhodospirillales bacterium]
MPAFTRRTLLGTAAASAAATAVPLRRGRAQSAPIRIGILTDMSGPYAEATGPGDVLAAQFAIEDFTKQHPEIKVELLQADMLLKPDVGATIARGWYDTQDVDAIFDIPHSGVAIAVGQVAKEKDKAVIFTGAGIPDLTGKYCSPNQIQWTYDLWSNSNAVTRGLVQGGRDTWYFVKFDYISGHTMAKDTATIVEQMGGKVLGMSAYPFPGTTDFSSYLLAAQASKAKVLCLANAGDDTSNCIKQAREFGLPQGGMTICALVYQDYIVQSVGLDQAQGIVGCMPFVWTKDEGTRAFAARFMPRYHNAAPNYYHAGCYSAVTHYLKAVAALGPDKAKASGRAAIAQMKAIPVDDPLFGKGHVRADGKHIHDTYVWQTKAPAESKGPWDFFNLVATIPAEKAFQPMDPQTCALAKA